MCWDWAPSEPSLWGRCCTIIGLTPRITLTSGPSSACLAALGILKSTVMIYPIWWISFLSYTKEYENTWCGRSELLASMLSLMLAYARVGSDPISIRSANLRSVSEWASWSLVSAGHAAYIFFNRINISNLFYFKVCLAKDGNLISINS